MSFDERTPVWVYAVRCGAAVIALGVLLTPAFPQEIALLNSRAPKLVQWLDMRVGVDLSDKRKAVAVPAGPTLQQQRQQQQRIRQLLQASPSYTTCQG